MKAEIRRISRFEPLVITLETQEEVDKLFAVLNFTEINYALHVNASSYKILYEQLGELINSRTNCYHKWHNRLLNAFNRNI